MKSTFLSSGVCSGSKDRQNPGEGDQSDDAPDLDWECDHPPAIDRHGRVHHRYNRGVNGRDALIALLVSLILLPTLAARGQTDGSTGTGEVSLKVAQFGLAGAARPGDWAGIELKVTDSAQQPRNVLLRIEVPDGDGDTALFRRVIVANPGVEQSAWLYAPLPFNVSAGSMFRITAHEAIDEGEGIATEDGARYTPGKLLASLAYPMANPVWSSQGMIAVVGRRTGGLDQYSANISQNEGFAPTGHEFTHIVYGMSPASLPDRWQGLAAFEALVWTGQSTEEQTLRLSAPQADAIREWVERGGHLIVIIPPAGQSWVDVPGNPLAPIVPEVTVQRTDGVNLDSYRQLLTRRADVVLPNNMVLHSFTPRQGAERFQAIPILDTPDGKTVVVRRLVGTGAVTLIGIDLTARAISDVAGALHADLLWNRVLGKRLPLLSPADFDSERTGDLTPNANPQRPPKWIGGRSDAPLDVVIGPAITRSAKAAAGLLLAFVVFLIYWLLAGPVGFYALKERNLKHYSWLGFVAAAGLFTAIAWGGANVLRSRKVEGQHLTFVDHVYGQSNQRMRSWFTLMLPKYGEQRVAIGEAKDAERWRHTLSSWDAGAGGSGLASFPDARPYDADARSPWRLDVPVRATTKTFRADWAGGLPGNWGMITPKAADGSIAGLGEELQLTRDAETPSRWKLSGKLTHSLPGPLSDVTIIVVLGQDNLPAPRNARVVYADGRLQARAWDFAIPGNKSWLPGDELDLSIVTGSDGSTPRLEMGAGLWNKLVPRPPAQFGGASPMELVQRNVPESLTALALFSVIPPPDPLVPGSQTLVRRSATHTYDLGRWFTQPCIIVIGHLASDAQGNGIETPLPLSIDSSPSDATRKGVLGRTVVRWVYPLPAAPPRYTASPFVVGGDAPAEAVPEERPVDDPAAETPTDP